MGGGESRIRTYEARSAADLQSAAINHSAISPRPCRSRSSLCTEPERGLEPLTSRLQIGCAANCATRARVELSTAEIPTQKRSAAADQVTSMGRNAMSGKEVQGFRKVCYSPCRRRASVAAAAVARIGSHDGWKRLSIP